MLRLLALGALAAALVPPGTAAAAEQKRALFFSPATVLENGATFSDPAGDSDFVPDIVSVSLSNDNAGKISFKVGFANRVDAFTVDDVLQIRIDADGAFYTGKDGFEYMLQVSVYGVELLKDGGGAYTFTDVPVEGDLTTAVLTLTLSVRDFADTASLRFYVATDSVSPSPGIYDWAPDGDALFRYDVDVPLLLDSWDAVLPAKAGTTFTLSGLFTTNNSGRGTVTCAATLRGKRLAGTARWTPSAVLPPSPPSPDFTMPGPYAFKANAGCSFKLPKTARRKTLKGTITLSKDGVVVRRAFSLRVR